MGSSKDFSVPEVAIRKLSSLLKANNLAEIEVVNDDQSIRVRAREEGGSSVIVSSPGTVPSVSSAESLPKSESTDLHIIRSPFIGTFYRSPSPSSASFVENGQAISKGQVICIVEAMKVMNEIESDSGGVIEKIYVENGDPVEFNAPLFGIRK